MSSLGSKLLKAGGAFSFAIAFLHIVVIVIGIPAYRFFGGIGDDMADLVEAGSVLPLFVTLFIASVFVLFGSYAVSGAGTIRRLPLLRTGLISTGSVYLLRGLMNIPFWLSLTSSTFPSAIRGIIFSTISFVIGLLYVCGAAMNWKRLKVKDASTPSAISEDVAK